MAIRRSFELIGVITVFFLPRAFLLDCSAENNEKLQVHLVPHTHDDVGWLKTVDEYYYGARDNIQRAGVQYILDSVMMELESDPTKTFIYVEMAFFKRWWDQQDESMKTLVRKFVKERRLEFINGGWSMNDEAAAHYNAIIDQMTVGLRFINDTFGEDARPTVAWHIDPFGHSAEQASLFSLMSFDGFFLGRIDYADKNKRVKEQRMEMVWRGSRNYGKASDIFTGVLYHNYSPPPGFCWDVLCWDPQMQDDPRLFDMNVKERVDAFVKWSCDQSRHFKTNHIILTMGEDFNYQNAHRYFKNMDKLIHYLKKDGRINAFYSTPSRYLKALHDADKSWEVKTDDFFPYSHRPHSYWTGYFTSRPTSKRYIRESNNILQACKQVEALGDKFGSQPSSDFLRRSMAVCQHHDAVTGTEKQHVADDYAKRLHMGRTDCQNVMNTFLKEKYPKKKKMKKLALNFERCDFLNISVCRITETKKNVAINFFNPSARIVQSYARIPVNSFRTLVFNQYNKFVQAQIQPISRSSVKLRDNLKGFATYEIIFPITVPPLGYTTYFLSKSSSKAYKGFKPIMSEKARLNGANNVVENAFVKLVFSPDTGQLVQMQNKLETGLVDVSQNFFYYEGCNGNKTEYQTSGAYIFRPRQQKPKKFGKYDRAISTLVKGPHLTEVRQIFSPYVTQVIRLYKNNRFAEFEHTIGPIPVKDKIGKEIITNFQTSIHNNGVFYTDANGREMKKRKRDYRETWNLDLKTEAVSRNYYPINSRIFINDSTTQLTVMTDRSQGGSSIRDGQLEVMLHRRLLHDDFLGVGEPLNETGSGGRGLVTRGKHYVFLSQPRDAAAMHRKLGEEMLVEPIVSFADNPYTPTQWQKGFDTVYTGLNSHIPENVHLLTLETTNNKNELILRLEHYYEKDEDKDKSSPVTVNIEKLFYDFTVTSFVEVNLSANQKLKDKKMWKWKTASKEDEGNNFDFERKRIVQKRTVGGRFDVTLNPMEIRTFLLQVKYN